MPIPLILPHTEDVCTITIFYSKIPYPLGLVLEIFSSILGHSLSTLLSPPESGAIPAAYKTAKPSSVSSFTHISPVRRWGLERTEHGNGQRELHDLRAVKDYCPASAERRRYAVGQTREGRKYGGIHGTTLSTAGLAAGIMNRKCA